MKWFEFVFCILASLLLIFFYLRGFFWGLIDYQINKSARKKRRQGMTFKEWFFYLRFRDEIPKIFLVLYFTVLIAHILVLILGCTFPLLRYFLARIFYIDSLVILLIGILFWQKKPGFNYGRWIEKGTAIVLVVPLIQFTGSY